MFTIEQIQVIHAQVKTGADFPQYVQNLKAIGIIFYDHFVSDGHIIYSGANGFQLLGEVRYPSLAIGVIGSSTALHHSLAIHQTGQTDYPTFCQQAAQAGVEKWRVDLLKMSCTYYDQAGFILVVEAIPRLD